MARIRTIKPDFCTSKDTAALTRDARLFFLQLLTECDDEGRVHWLPKRVCGVLYPDDEDVTPAMIRAWAQECADRRMVQIYTVDGAEYLQVTNWKKHQKISHPAESRLPAPTDSGVSPEELRKGSGGPQEELRPDLGTGKKEEEREGEQGDGAAPARSAPPESQPVDLIMANGQMFHVDPALVTEWQGEFPKLDVPAELQQMRRWLDTHPRQRKTPTGMKRFCVGWLERSLRDLQANAGKNNSTPPRQTDEELADDVRRHLGMMQ